MLKQIIEEGQEEASLQEAPRHPTTTTVNLEEEALEHQDMEVE